jgi:hypothetical protein
MYIEGSNMTKKSTTKDGITKEVTVVKAENGYIICVRTSGSSTEKNYKEISKYEETSKYFISKEDPFESEKEDKEEEEISESPEIMKAIKNLDL